MTRDHLAWLACSTPGCHAGIAVDLRHVDNLTAAGGWECREHEGRDS
ncbi:hypothetical protein [Nocardioides sp.]|nr:hypothetical protein [Nocardioides sp.]MCW2738867.1 hypothetical protein [Nocardioides sp.]